MNVDVPCPQCGTVFTIKSELLGKRSKCTNCGNVFVLTAPAAKQAGFEHRPSELPASIFPGQRSTHQPAPTTAPPFVAAAVPPAGNHARPTSELFGFEQDSTRPRFAALRIVAKAYEVMAVIVLAFAAFMLVMFFIAVISEPTAIVKALFATGLAFFWAVVTALTLLFIAQAIRLGLQVEQNTRETQLACRQLADHLCSVANETYRQNEPVSIR